jgi:hypothetical protein
MSSHQPLHTLGDYLLRTRNPGQCSSASLVAVGACRVYVSIATARTGWRLVRYFSHAAAGPVTLQIHGRAATVQSPLQTTRVYQRRGQVLELSARRTTVDGPVTVSVGLHPASVMRPSDLARRITYALARRQPRARPRH